MYSLNTRIIIAGGGTGGHIFPAIAIANALRKKEASVELLFVGAKGKMEMEKVPQAGYRIKGIDIAGFNRSSLIKNLGLPFKLMKSFFQVRSIVREFRPDAVIGVGGYASFPLLRYAQSRHIPSFIHEPNSYAGKSNMLLSHRATRIFVASDGMEQFFPAEKLILVGNPVRKAIVQSTVGKAEALRAFGLQEGKTTILAIGGSQGARSINEAIAGQLDAFASHDLQLIWQTGKGTVAEFSSAAEGKKGIWVSDFITDMDRAYAAADIVISRSGSTLYELCVVKKPVIFIPFPNAAEDHQTVNAERLVRKNAAWMIPDKEAREKLIPAMLALAADPKTQEELSENIGRLAVTDADDRIAAEILNMIHA